MNTRLESTRLERRRSSLRVSFIPPSPPQDIRRNSLPCTPPESPSDFAFFPKSTTTAVHIAYPNPSPPITPVRSSHLPNKSDECDDLPMAYAAGRKSSFVEQRRSSILTDRRLSTPNLYALAHGPRLTPLRALYLFLIVFSATYLASFVPVPSFLRSSRSGSGFVTPPAGYYRPPPPSQQMYANDSPTEDERRAWANYRDSSSSGNRVPPRQQEKAKPVSDYLLMNPNEAADASTNTRRRAKTRISVDEESGDRPIPVGQIYPGRNGVPLQKEGAGMSRVPRKKGGAGAGALGRPEDSGIVTDRVAEPREAVRKMMKDSRPPPVVGAAAAAKKPARQHAAPPPPRPAPAVIAPESEDVEEAEEAAPSEIVDAEHPDDADDETEEVTVQPVAKAPVRPSRPREQVHLRAKPEPLVVTQEQIDEPVVLPPPRANADIKQVMNFGPKGGMKRRPKPAGAPPRRFKKPVFEPEAKRPVQRGRGAPKRGSDFNRDSSANRYASGAGGLDGDGDEE